MGRTLVGIVLDESGSMANAWQSTIDGFNEYIQELQKEKADEAAVTLTKFNSVASIKFKLEPVDHVAPLSRRNYQPSGMTALYDAIAYTVNHLENEVRDGDRVVITVLTDGHENSSRETTREQVLALLDRKEKQGNWTFVYLGADQDAITAQRASQSIGIRSANTVSYEKGRTSDVYASLASVSNRMRRSGSLSSNNFGAVVQDSLDDPDKRTELVSSDGS